MACDDHKKMINTLKIPLKYPDTTILLIALLPQICYDERDFYGVFVCFGDRRHEFLMGGGGNQCFDS